MLLSSTTVNGALSNDSNNNITMSVGNTVIANVNSSGIYFESGKKAIYTGAVLQSNQAYTATSTSSTTATWADVTGLSVSITPSSTSSKVLVLAAVQWEVYRAAIEATGSLKVVRNSTDIFTDIYNSLGFEAGLSTGSRIYMDGRWCCAYIDSPSSTSATTYKIQLYCGSVGSSGRFTVNNQGAGQTSSIVVMEIAG